MKTWNLFTVELGAAFTDKLNRREVAVLLVQLIVCQLDCGWELMSYELVVVVSDSRVHLK